MFVNKNVLVEAYTDLGPIVEMIVKCPSGTGIISYSKSRNFIAAQSSIASKAFMPRLNVPAASLISMNGLLSAAGAFTFE